MENLKIKLHIPSWVATVYIGGCLLLLPWTIYLDQTLPARHVFHHWDIAWVGLDLALIISLALTAFFAHRKSPWVVMTYVSTGSFLLVDAWFDVMSARQGHALEVALLLAVFLELPLALTSYFLSYKALKKAHMEDKK